MGRSETNGGVAIANIPIIPKQGDDQANAPLRKVPLNGLNILVVDDSEDALTLIKIVLSKAGAHVVSAVDGRKALDIVYDNNIDFIVSDINMPEMNGYEFLQNTRQIETQKGRAERPAIALTSCSTAKDCSRAYQAGYNLHLVKPVQPQRLVDQIVEVWNKQKAG